MTEHSEPEAHKSKISIFLVLTMALSVGFVTVLVACAAGLHSLRQPYSRLRENQIQTTWRMQFIAELAFEAYKKEHGSYPLTLEELTSQPPDSEGPILDEKDLANWIEDGWRNPMIYVSDGETWELISYGADGKPGGFGLDADLRCTDSTHRTSRADLLRNAVPTVGQVVYSEDFRSSLFFGVPFGVILSLVTMRRLLTQKGDQRKSHKFLIVETLGLIIITSIFITFLISIQSMSSGH